MANGERGCKGDDLLEGIGEEQKQHISDIMFPTTTKKQEKVQALGLQLMKNPSHRFDGMKLFIEDQERVDLSVEAPYDLMSNEDYDTV